MRYGLLILILLKGIVIAEPRIYGIDHLGLGNRRYCDTFISSHPNNFAVGVFTQKNLFGDPSPCLDPRMSKGGIPLVRYNLRWSDTHSFRVSDFPSIVDEAKRFLPLVNKYQNVECEFSGATEHQLNQRDAQKLADMVLAVIPERCKYVNNPWANRGAFITPTNRVKNEVHGGGAQKPRVGGKYNFSFDGTDMFDVYVTDMKRKLSDADVFFFWTSQNNGRFNAKDKTPRPQRKAYPTAELISAQAFAATEQGDVSLPKNFTVKPKADQHTVPPGKRELKPVLIFPTNVRQIQLRANGKIFTSSQGQPFNDGRTRYYFDKYGYQMVREAGANVFQVGRIVERAIDRQKAKVFQAWGTTNPGFRQGGEYKQK